ncbi:hypothetical protein [uncultured Aquabacterium sp.]|uniref:hypothetical protein n=1 Tax=uncultured Aquabacterium sp. TaxID=158753 RepID=UPI0026223D31|nr:hypothetical protein [uncultured Aquabacterium sp.]
MTRWSFLHVRPAWADAIDFVGPRRRASVWGWALLGVGLLMALQVSDEVASLQQAHADTQAEGQRLGRAVRKAELSARLEMQAPTGSSTGQARSAAPQMSRSEWRHAAEMAEVLAHDWLATLDGADERATRARVVLTGLRLQVGRAEGAGEAGAAQLQAAVPDDRTALRWVDSLGPQAQLRGRQRLPQPVSDGQGEHVWRVDATWPEAGR